MKFRYKKLAGMIVSLLLLSLLSISFTYAEAPTATYEVTITNLTDGQAFSPPVVVTHRQSTDIFNVGDEASLAIQEIAENGNNEPMLAALGADKHVFDFTQVADGNEGPAPLIPADNPGQVPFANSATYTVTAGQGVKYLSAAMMLICTNDGFTGIDSVRLPKEVGDSTTVHTAGYDAGTEINTEDFADIVPPCQVLIGISSEDSGTGTTNPDLAEDDVIRHHPGIVGGGDLVPGVHGWIDPVAEIVITRVN
ncbi:MAG: spondin domain-containing protein [Anaerolineae bacterium]|nr:spondin domain-containing protein [Anaerolineae bacterium]